MKPGRLAAALWKNPLIQKDLRTRMRGKKAFFLIAAHLAVLGLATGVVYWVFYTSLSSSGNLEERRYFGKAVFGLAIWLEMMMVSFVAPALTSGAISTEREHQTYDLLRVTLISARQIVLGKYLPGLIFLLLLLITSIPMQAPAFLIGGVLWQEILFATLILVVTTVTISALGLLISALIQRTLIAMTLTYTVSIINVFGAPVLGVLFILILRAGFPGDLADLTPLNIGLLVVLVWTILSLTPLGAMIITDLLFIDQGSLLIGELTLSSEYSVRVPSPWIIFTSFYLFASLVMLWLSINRVERLPDE